MTKKAIIFQSIFSQRKIDQKTSISLATSILATSISKKDIILDHFLYIEKR